MAKIKNLLILFLCNLLFLKVISKCPKSFPCGPLGSLKFPFSEDSNCGLFLVKDCDSGSPTLHLSNEMPSRGYNIVGNISTNNFTLYNSFRQRELSEKSCTFFRNLDLPQSPFVSFKFSPNLTFYTCFNLTPNDQIQDYFLNHRRVDCLIRPPTVYYRNLATHAHVMSSSMPTTCSMIQLPAKSSQVPREPLNALTAAYTLEWDVSQDCYECNDRGGQCVSDNMNKFHCREKGTYYFANSLIKIYIFFW